MKKYIFLVFLVVIGAGGYYLFNNLEIIVRKLVNKYGSEITGTKVDLQGFKLNLTTGEGKIQKFTVANPKGYNSPYLFSTDEIYVKVNMKSLTSNTIVIDEIKVDRPAMTYEMMSITQNNISEVLDNVKRNTQKSENESAAKKEAKPESKSAAGKKVVINKITVTGTNLKAEVQTPAIPGVSEASSVSQDVTLPTITIRDIGKEKSGESIAVVISKVMTRILSEASTAVVSNKLGDLKGVAEKNLNKAVDQVKDKMKSTTDGLFNSLKIK